MKLIVNGKTIDQKEIDQEVDRLRPQYQRFAEQHGGKSSHEELHKWCKENLIERTLMQQAAVAEVSAIPPSEIADFRKAHEAQFKDMKQKQADSEIRLYLQSQNLIKKITADLKPVNDDDIQNYYDTNKEHFVAPEQVHARHVVKHIDANTDKANAYVQILNAQEQLKKGVSFEEVAGAASDCPENAGDLGYFGRGQMVQAFEDVVFNMNVDDVSEPFLTEFGYHIVKLLDKREGGPVPLEQVKDHIAKQLTEKQKSDAIESYVDGLKAKADIKEEE